MAQDMVSIRRGQQVKGVEKECNNEGHWKTSGQGRRGPHLTCPQILVGILVVCLGGPPKFQCRTCAGIFGGPQPGHNP